ncbi:MAG: YfiT family bacillithiol transferase [Rhodothermales bacterium]
MATTDLRYPIGPFHRPEAVTAADRREAIDQIAALPENLRAAVHGLTDVQLGTPYRSEGWTVRQVVHHVADSHVNAYARFRLALTEEQPTIKPYEEARWAELPDARTAPLAPSLDLLDALHDRWVRLLRSLEDDAWPRSWHNPETGTLALGEALVHYAWHGRHHTAHITALREREGW